MPTTTWERCTPERREAILRAAKEEFLAHGYHGGSLNVIARTAGVSKGSLFQYFTDKADLYSYLAELSSEQIRSDIDEIAGGLDWASDFWRALVDLGIAWERYFHEHAIELAASEMVNIEVDGDARVAVRELANSHYLDVVRGLLAMGQACGAVREDVDEEAFLYLGTVLLPAIAFAPHNPGLDPVLGLGSPDETERHEAVRRIIAVVRDAFGPR